ncbi:MAG: sulfatase-like hydrolase/transferase [Hyphomonadaceae bacterium]|nr:sulfatase-like hydrolase/transferase [Hyphomonadaceae bacterium]
MPEARPNFLFILADDLGFSDIGAFGAEIHTPHLDKLAREGRILTSMYAAPLPLSRAEALTGASHHLAGMASMYSAWGAQTHSPNYLRALSPNTATLPETLREAGYFTAMVGAWHLGDQDAQSPSARGFERSFALLHAAGERFPPRGDQAAAGRPPTVYRADGHIVPAPDAYITDYFTDRLISYLAAEKSRPFFAYVPYTAPHFPLQITDAFFARYRGFYDDGFEALRLRRIARQKEIGLFAQEFAPAAPVAESDTTPRWASLSCVQKAREARRMEIYAAMVENLDWNIGRLIEALRAQGRYDDTCIVFSSCNGAAHAFPEAAENNAFENMGRRDSWIYYTERWAEASNAPFSRWKAKTTEGGVAVPGIVRLPRETAGAPPSDAVVTLRDVMPTFLDLAGVEPPRVQTITGRSMLAHLRGQAPSVHPSDAVFAEECSGEGYVRQGAWKAVVGTDLTANSFERNDPAVADHIAALRAGDFRRAKEIRARWPLVWRLYNVRTDRGETRDLAAMEPQKLAHLQGLYRDYCRANGVVDP